MVRSEKTVKVCCVGIFSGVATLLMIMDFPLWFLPGFYKFDLSEVISLTVGLMFGPVPGIMVEFLKNILKIIIRGTSTYGLGEFANFCIGSTLVVSSSYMYNIKRTKKQMIKALITGSIIMTIFSVIANLILLLPVYSYIIGVDINQLIGKSFFVYIFSFVVPFNFVKASISSLLCFLIYKRISSIFKKLL